jgi:hypothetical protein
MPFLYQTKTLASTRTLRLSTIQNFSRTSRRAFKTFDRLGAAGSRSDGPKASLSSRFPHIPVAQPSNPFEGPILSSEGGNVDGGVIRKVAWDKAPQEKEQRPVEQAAIPFEDADDDLADLDLISASDPFLTDEEVFDDDHQPSELFNDPDAIHTQKKSTITVQERTAFQRIFADIMSRSQSTSESSIDRFEQKFESLSTNEDGNLSQLSPEKKLKATSSLYSLMDDAVKAAPDRRAYSLKTQEELLQDVGKYPQPLRAAAAQALGLVSSRNIQDEPEVNSDMENLRQPELERVEALMRKAATDLELWQVMEQEVFSIPGKFGLVTESPPLATAMKSHKKKKKQKKNRKTAEEHTPPLLNDMPELSLSIHGPLYPSHLLLGLRLLDRSFTKPSQLVLNILPRIKSMGIISQALGTSTALYNELLRIYWMRYDNFLGVIALLEEMEVIGLEMNAETLKVVTHIDRLQQVVEKGEKGTAIQKLWSMPEFGAGRFREWRKKIHASLQVRGDETSVWDN